MAVAGFPGAFQGAYTTGNRSIGATQKQVTQAGFPGAFQGAYTTSYLDIGAVQKAVSTGTSGLVSFLSRLMLMGAG